ncbi:hypothetical protein BJV74DRAFT_718521, partial [Russula compacta]
WLKDFHSKIWNRMDLKPQLFRRVELTYAHYVALERRLNEQHPDRDSPDYNARKYNVLRDKLYFLRSMPPADALAPRHPDNNDDRVGGDDDDDDDSGTSNEDNREIKSLFPFTLSSLDLSDLELENKVTNRLPLPLLLRQEYDYISELIDERPRNNGGSVIVSGQPGTGKTAYLYLRIIEQMIKGCSFLFQVNRTTVYHVFENGVEVISSWPLEKEIVAFVDGNKGDHSPKDFLLDRFVQLVVASSPNGPDQPWRKQGGHGASVIAFVAKLWSLKELILTGIFLHPDDISFALLSESMTYFGYNPRQCFEASTSVQYLIMKKKELMERIVGVASEGNQHILQLLNLGGPKVSHTIIQISPSDPNPNPSADTGTLLSLAGCKFEPVSRWALNFLLQQYDIRRAEELAHFYFMISPTKASFKGILFEAQVLKHLEGIKGERAFDIRPLTDSIDTKWTYRGPVRRFTFDNQFTAIKEITNAVQNNKPLLLVPSKIKFPATDSILYDPNDPNAVLTCIQITLNERHPLVVSGLQHIQTWFKRGTPLADLRPSKTRPWRFLFVVPSNMFLTFKLHNLKDDTPTGAWATKVHQYV